MIRLLAPLLLLLACTPSPSTTPSPSARPTSAARTLDGGGQLWRVDAETLASLVAAPSDKPRSYNFWATWCAPCIAEMPTLVAYGRAHPEVELWFVDTDHPKAVGPKVDKIMAEQDLGAFLHLQPTADELDLFRVLDKPPAALPTTFVVDTSGERSTTLMGAVSAAQLDEAIAKAR